MRNRLFLKKRFKIISIIGIVMVLLGMGYSIQHINNSRDRVIAKLEVCLKQGDLNSLRNLVEINEDKVAKEDLKPLMQYYMQNSQAIDNLISSLKKGKDTSVFNIRNKKKGILNIYKLELNTYNIKIDSNFESSTFTIDNEKYINSGESIENVIPGIYTVKGLLHGDYGDIETTHEFLLMNDEELKIKFNAINVSVKSIFKDAQVYINGEDTGKKVEEIDEIGPFQTDGSSSVYIEKEFPWGRIRSEEEYIKDIPVINLDIDIKNDNLVDDLTEVSNKFYLSVFNALNAENKSDITNSEEQVKNKIYSVLQEKYILLKNKYSIDNINIVQDKSEFTYNEGVYKANVLVDVDYVVEKRLFGLEKNKVSKNFFTKLIYDEENKEWIVSDVENFSL